MFPVERMSDDVQYSCRVPTPLPKSHTQRTENAVNRSGTQLPFQAAVAEKRRRRYELKLRRGWFVSENGDGGTATPPPP